MSTRIPYEDQEPIGGNWEMHCLIKGYMASQGISDDLYKGKLKT